MSVPAEILKKVKLLEIRTRKLVNNAFSGEYHTHFKGQGMTFAEFREYVPGDDVRSISWALTARTGTTYIKKFDEERELSVILAVDISGSVDFGSGAFLKGEVMTHLSALLSMAANRNRDQVGLLLFSDQIEHYVPPKKGAGHVHRLLRDLYFVKPRSSRTKISVALDYLQSILKKRATVFIISDFMDQGFETQLKSLAKKHEVVAMVVEDPAELKIPSLGLVDLQDPESLEIVTVDSSNPQFQKDFSELYKRKQKSRDEILRKAQVEKVLIQSKESFVEPVIAFFRKRNVRN